MQRAHRTGISIAMIGALASLPLLEGCAKPGQVSVSPEAAVGKALGLYDPNNDGAIGAEEAGSCPPLPSSRRSYAAAGGGRLAAEEIANRLKQPFESSSELGEVRLPVTL